MSVVRDRVAAYRYLGEVEFLVEKMTSSAQ